MKTTIKLFYLLLAILFVTSCEKTSEGVTPQLQSAKTTLYISSADDLSRVNMEKDGDAIAVSWCNDGVDQDSFSLYDASGVWVANFTYEGADGATSGEFTSDAEVEDGTYTAIYPSATNCTMEEHRAMAQSLQSQSYGVDDFSTIKSVLRMEATITIADGLQEGQSSFAHQNVLFAISYTLDEGVSPTSLKFVEGDKDPVNLYYNSGITTADNNYVSYIIGTPTATDDERDLTFVLTTSNVNEYTYSVATNKIYAAGYVYDMPLSELSPTTNPNYFSFVSYGNNLGLDTSVHASQYMVESENAFNLIDLTPTTDAKAGVELKYSMTGLRNATNWTINSSTGVITLGDYKGASECSAVLVTTTAGYGTDTEVSVSTPVFFYYATGKDGVKVKYTPFVFKVNPKSGGRMEIIPELDGYTGDKSDFLMDFRRTFSYYNIGGPESHISGTIGTSEDEMSRFISKLWEKYYTDHTTREVNYLSKSPMSWYNNQAERTSGADGSDSIDNALGYVDATDLSIVVNPEKWIYDGEYANGIFTAQMLFVTNGTASDIDSATTYIFPIWIWFDEKF